MPENPRNMVLHMFVRLLVVRLLSCETPEGRHLGFIQNGRHRGAQLGSLEKVYNFCAVAVGQARARVCVCSLSLDSLES